MSNKTDKKVKKPLDLSSKIIIVGLIIIAIPVAILAYILISAYVETGNVIVGDRYKGDLDPAIVETDISAVETEIKSIADVENVSIELPSGTLRVYVDTTDSLNVDQVKGIANSCYDALIAKLPVETYFTQNGNKRMYDIEIHVYNLAADRDSDAFAYVIKSKSSSMEAPIERVVSEPIDAELAQQLVDKMEAANKTDEEKAAEISQNTTEGE